MQLVATRRWNAVYTDPIDSAACKTHLDLYLHRVGRGQSDLGFIVSAALLGEDLPAPEPFLLVISAEVLEHLAANALGECVIAQDNALAYLVIQGDF
jgi:hypothetical protein